MMVVLEEEARGGMMVGVRKKDDGGHAKAKRTGRQSPGLPNGLANGFAKSIDEKKATFRRRWLSGPPGRR